MNEPAILTRKIPTGNLNLGRSLLSTKNLNGAPSAAPIEKMSMFTRGS